MSRWFLILLASLGVASQAHEAGTRPPALLPASQQEDAIHVYKAQRRLDLLRDGRVIATYRIVLGGVPVGHKR